MKNPEPTIKDILLGYKATGDAASAAQLLRLLAKRDRGTVRKYPNSKRKKDLPSSSWQLTRSHAVSALTAMDEETGLPGGVWNPASLLGTRIIDAITIRPGESAEDRRKRAVEVFGACLDAAESLTNPKKIDFFCMVDAIVDATIGVLESGRFPTPTEAANLTGIKGKGESEWTKARTAGHLSFLYTPVPNLASPKKGRK